LSNIDTLQGLFCLFLLVVLLLEVSSVHLDLDLADIQVERVLEVLALLSHLGVNFLNVLVS